MNADYILKDGHIIDGSGTHAGQKESDIVIEGDLIKEIGALSNSGGRNIINVKGLCVSPGFIDAHAHSEFSLLADGRAAGKISQGITTEVNGNCGLSAAPLYGPAREQRERDLSDFGITERWATFSEYFAILEKKGIAVNFATLLGHGNLRASTAGYADAPLSLSDKKRMKELLVDAMLSGARGMSTGLIYPPGIYSDTAELVEFAREISTYGGVYTTHMRSEGDELIESIDEVIEIAEKGKIHAHISHLKTSGEQNWGKLDRALATISRANENNISVTCDRYPYIASSTDLDSILPAWAFEGGREQEMKRLKSKRKRLARDIVRVIPGESFWRSVVISSVCLDHNKWMQGKSVAEISNRLEKTALEFLFDILLEEQLQVAAIFFLMNEDNLKSILSYPYTMIGTDSSARCFDGITARGMPHPRGFGSFPRVLGTYVRKKGILDLSTAIHKMTGLPARVFNIEKRGRIARGYFADLVVFDPLHIKDCAEFGHPFCRPEGVYHVFVNGTPVMLDGEMTNAMPGRVLRE